MPLTKASKQERVNFARSVIRHYDIQRAGECKDDETSITELLTDLLHYCQREGIDFRTLFAMAVMHFDAEK